MRTVTVPGHQTCLPGFGSIHRQSRGPGDRQNEMLLAGVGIVNRYEEGRPKKYIEFGWPGGEPLTIPALLSLQASC